MNRTSKDTDAGEPKWEFRGRESQECRKAKSQKIIKSCLPITVIGVSQEIVVLKEPWVILSLLLLFGHWVMFESLWPHGLQHASLPCLSLSPRVYSDSRPSSQWCHPTITSSVTPFSSCLQSFPASGSFQVSQLFSSGGQSIGASASASVLPMTIQGWFPVGLTGLISLQSKGLSSVFSTPQFKSFHFLALNLLYGPTLTSIHDSWENHSFDYIDLCWQSDVTDF